MGAPYQPNSDTSRAAAESVEPKVNNQQQEMLAQFRAFPSVGFTDDDLLIKAEVGAMRISPNGVRARRIELQRKGLIRKSGRTRITRSNRLATVWVIA